MKIFVSHFIANELSKQIGVEMLPLFPYDKLDVPVCTHADMLVFVMKKRIFCYSDYCDNNRSVFDVAEKEGYEIVKISKQCSKKYPNDISLNILVMGNCLFANLKHIAIEVLEYATENGYNLIDVKQGYCACATLVLDENNAITADEGIYKAIISSGKNATLISGDGIRLDGYSCGFIGGASSVVGKSVYFFGDIKKHPDYKKIHEKIETLNMTEFSITRGDVFDFGGTRII